MSTLISQIILIYVVGTQPLVHVQGISPFSDLESCQKTIAIVASQEKEDPEEKQIHKRLQCIKFSYRYTPDGDGPSKIVAPQGEAPAEDLPVEHPIYKTEAKCKSASYVQ